MIVVKDPDNNYIDLSNATRPIVGSGFIGANIQDIFLPEHSNAIAEHDALTRAKGGDAVQYNQTILTPWNGWRRYHYKQHSPDSRHVITEVTDLTDTIDAQGVLKHLDFRKRTVFFPRLKITLTEPEFIILNRYLRGWPIRRIAQEINRTIKAVEKHLTKWRASCREHWPGCTLLEAFQKSGTLFVMLDQPTWFPGGKKSTRGLISRDFPTDTRKVVR